MNEAEKTGCLNLLGIRILAGRGKLKRYISIAFTIPLGHFKFNVMPFGLTNARCLMEWCASRPDTEE